MPHLFGNSSFTILSHAAFIYIFLLKQFLNLGLTVLYDFYNFRAAHQMET